MNRQWQHRISPLEALGFRPFVPALKQCLKAIAGDRLTKPSRWGLSSLRIALPKLGIRTWLGLRAENGRIPVFNLFNRRHAPRDAGYDVRVTDVVDFRGREVSYNSHMGVDFAVPVGTDVVAPAPGRVVVVENLMYRGGLKVVLDHGDGLISICAHLSRTLVAEGATLTRGELLGLSGYSAIDGVISFPWIPPHVHFTVLFGGEPEDPFGQGDETPLWIDGNDPRPCPGPDAPFAEPARDDTPWDHDAVARCLASLRDTERRGRIAAIEDLEQRASHLAYWRFYNYTAFDARPELMASPPPRVSRLSLPFRYDEASGIEIIERDS